MTFEEFCATTDMRREFHAVLADLGKHFDISVSGFGCFVGSPPGGRIAYDEWGVRLDHVPNRIALQLYDKWAFAPVDEATE